MSTSHLMTHTEAKQRKKYVDLGPKAEEEGEEEDLFLFQILFLYLQLLFSTLPCKSVNHSPLTGESAVCNF